jgi:nitrite reductase (NADH) large subunit
VEIVIVGGNVAGFTVSRFISKKKPDWNLRIFSGEPHLYYPRPKLIDLLAGEISEDETIIYDMDWYEEQGIDYRKSEVVLNIDKQNKTVETTEGEYQWDKLVLACGSCPFVPPIEGVEKEGVFTFRTLQDVEDILEYIEENGVERVGVIGGGILGIETANSLNRRGLDVVVLNRGDRLLEKQLDERGGELFAEMILEKGIEVRMNSEAKEITGDDKVEGIKLKEGGDIPAGLVIVSTGVRPGLELAERAGLEFNRGILVDDHLNVEGDIYALGDCVEHRGVVYGIIPPVVEQASVLVSSLTGDGEMTYEGTVPTNTLKVADIHLTTMGDFRGEEGDTVISKESGECRYRKLIIRDGKLAGFILMECRGEVRPAEMLLKNGYDISDYIEDIRGDDITLDEIYGEVK